MNTVIERVYRGATLLDRVIPGWENSVNLDALDMSSVESCILAQVFGTYNSGVEELGLPVLGDAAHDRVQSDDCQHGFDNACFYNHRDPDTSTFDDLDREWTAIIENRRSMAVMVGKELAHV